MPGSTEETNQNQKEGKITGQLTHMHTHTLSIVSNQEKSSAHQTQLLSRREWVPGQL